MENIIRHTGINLGGINSINWMYCEDISLFNISATSLYCAITPITGKDWNSFYATPETMQLDSEQQDTPSGIKYVYKLKALIPKDRIDVENQLFQMTGRCLILKITDKNNTIRILGTMNSPMKITSKLLKPLVLEGFNGYDILFSGEFSKPAFFMHPPGGGISID